MNRSYGQTQPPIKWDPGYEVRELPFEEGMALFRIEELKQEPQIVRQWADTTKGFYE